MTALTLPGLPFPLEPAGSPPPGCRVRHGVLTLTAAAGTDLFIDPAGTELERFPDAGRSAGLPPSGDFTLATQVTVEFASMYDAGVLLLHARERHWAKLCFEYSPQLRPTAVTVVTRGVSGDCNSFEVDGNTLWLRITRSGAAWAFHASADGSWWRLLRYFALSGDAAELVKVGFLAQSPAGEGCAATFDHIEFRAGAPKNLRKAADPPGQRRVATRAARSGARRSSTASRAAWVSQCMRAMSGGPSNRGGQPAAGVRSSMTSVPPGRSRASGSAGSPSTLPCPPPSSTSRSKGPSR